MFRKQFKKRGKGKRTKKQFIRFLEKQTAAYEKQPSKYAKKKGGEYEQTEALGNNHMDVRGS